MERGGGGAVVRIGCSGQVSERSGIGVVQKHLYEYLIQAGHELVFSEARDVGTSPLAKTRGLARGFRPAGGPIDVYLSAVPPLPVGVRAPMLTIVHDLRWRRTRSKAGAAYRAWDLHRTVRRSQALLCISESTRRSLVEFDVRAVPKASVQLLGAGQTPENSFEDSHTGILMLVGGAAHKCNEFAAEVLAAARPPWVRGIVGVGVGDQVRQTLSAVFTCEWFDQITDAEMVGLYQRSEFFLMLGVDEGFGLPFVEALASGCQVIATDHPLAREVLGDAGVLIPRGCSAETAGRLLRPPFVPAGVRAERANAFSWRSFGEAYEAALTRIGASAT